MAYYSLNGKQFTTLELSVRIIEKKNYYKIFSTPKPYALIFSCNAEKLEEILQYNNSDTVLPPNSRLPNSRSLQIHGFVSISRKLLIHGFRSKFTIFLPIHGHNTQSAYMYFWYSEPALYSIIRKNHELQLGGFSF